MNMGQQLKLEVFVTVRGFTLFSLHVTNQLMSAQWEGGDATHNEPDTAVPVPVFFEIFLSFKNQD